MIQFVLVVSGAGEVPSAVYGPGADRGTLMLIGSRLAAADPAAAYAVIEMAPIPIVPEPPQASEAPVAEPPAAAEPPVSEPVASVEGDGAADTEAQVQPEVEKLAEKQWTHDQTEEVFATKHEAVADAEAVAEPEEEPDELPAQ